MLTDTLKQTAHVLPYRLGVAKPRPRTRNTVIRNLTWLMAKRQWSQRDLAARSGVSQRQISNILNGIGAPSIETTEALAVAFGLHNWQLLNDDLPTDLLESPHLRKLVSGWISGSDEDREYLNLVAERAAKYNRK